MKFFSKQRVTLGDGAHLCYYVCMSKITLPESFKPLLWSYDISRLDVERDKNRIVINTINYGDLSHWRWLVDVYSAEKVRRIIETIPISEFRPGALKLVSLLLGISQHNNAYRGADRISKNTLATA